jgi:hypothetical protein
LGEHRRHDTDGIRLEIAAPGCRAPPVIEGEATEVTPSHDRY